jgi:hypothetical protein
MLTMVDDLDFARLDILDEAPGKFLPVTYRQESFQTIP